MTSISSATKKAKHDVHNILSELVIFVLALQIAVISFLSTPLKSRREGIYNFQSIRSAYQDYTFIYNGNRKPISIHFLPGKSAMNSTSAITDVLDTSFRIFCRLLLQSLRLVNTGSTQGTPEKGDQGCSRMLIVGSYIL